MFCRNCGNKILNEEASFCNACGAPLKKAAPTSQAHTAAAVPSGDLDSTLRKTRKMGRRSLSTLVIVAVVVMALATVAVATYCVYHYFIEPQQQSTVEESPSVSTENETAEPQELQDPSSGASTSPSNSGAGSSSGTNASGEGAQGGQPSDSGASPSRTTARGYSLLIPDYWKGKVYISAVRSDGSAQTLAPSQNNDITELFKSLSSTDTIYIHVDEKDVTGSSICSVKRNAGALGPGSPSSADLATSMKLPDSDEYATVYWEGYAFYTPSFANTDKHFAAYYKYKVMIDAGYYSWVTPVEFAYPERVDLASGGAYSAESIDAMVASGDRYSLLNLSQERDMSDAENEFIKNNFTLAVIG